jgi:hypothetical protein
VVDAALESRIRKALKDQAATCPKQQGAPGQNPTARWICQYCVGVQVRLIPGQWEPVVVNRTEERPSLLRVLGKPAARFYR